MGTQNLPLLHKYVLSSGDDMQLQLTKLRYRLCVREVGEVLAKKNPEFYSPAIMEGSVTTDGQLNGDLNNVNKDMDAPLDASSPIDTKSPSIDDSGIVCDESRLSGPEDAHIELNGVDISLLQQEESPASGDKDSAEDKHDYSQVQEEEIVSIRHERQERGYHIEASAELAAESLPMDTDIDQDLSGQLTPEIVVSEPQENAQEDEQVITLAAEANFPDETPVEEELVQEETIVKEELERKPQFDEEALNKAAEPEPEPEPEVPRVEFRRGMNKVDNVDDALDILKTRYRLSGIPTRKIILTWSSWNLKDLIHQPYDDDDDDDDFDDEDSPVWADKKDNDILESEEVVDLLDTILDKEKELEELLESVLEEERKKRAGKADKQKEDVPVSEEVVKVEAAPAAQAAATPEPDEVTECKNEPEKDNDKPQDEAAHKKRGNLLARMIRALRKRLGRRERA